MAEKYKAVIAVPPGETLAEMLADRKMMQKQLAARMGLSIKHINEIVQGKSPITIDTALKLEAVLGVPASFWMNLETNYQETNARLAAEETIMAEIPLAKEFPYPAMAKLGMVRTTRDNREKVFALREFFGVASLETLPNVIPAAYRKAAVRQASPMALAAWLRQGETAANQMDVVAFQRDKLKEMLPLLRSLTLQMPEVFCTEMEKICASCGIALVFVPHLPKTYAHGATYWLSSERAVVQMSLRGKYADVFWFSFFHELGHLVLGHSKKETFISYDGATGLATPKEEKDADHFAADILVPGEEYRAFIKKGDFSLFAIRHLAEKLGIHSGIVVGRLQHEGHLEYHQGHALRTTYQFE